MNKRGLNGWGVIAVFVFITMLGFHIDMRDGKLIDNKTPPDTPQVAGCEVPNLSNLSADDERCFLPAATTRCDRLRYQMVAKNMYLVRVDWTMAGGVELEGFRFVVKSTLGAPVISSPSLPWDLHDTAQIVFDLDDLPLGHYTVQGQIFTSERVDTCETDVQVQ